jgi:glutamate-ammonia-ligase adenylyltransferase
MAVRSTLESLAYFIDPARARDLRYELAGGRSEDVAVLLATAYPVWMPAATWKREALDAIVREGWTTDRTRPGYLLRLSAAMQDVRDPEQGWAQLRQLVWREKARIALRELLPHDLGGATFDVTAGELSALAEAVFEIALREAANEAQQRFGPPLRSDGNPSTLVMIGLGKLGGHELNPGSDVDVIFVYDTDDGGSQRSLHAHWAQVVRRAVEFISTPNEFGLIWRVDLRLRPEGSKGPIANSAQATERYYETWGRLWERAALLRARTSAGDPELGRALAREVFTPFVYRHEVDPSIATALADLVQRSRRELSPAPDRDVKLGPGGIREAEFFVQSLQLIWGGRERTVRVPGFFEALERLGFRGLVSDREVRDLSAAYALLRRVEHRIQWMRGVQTHLLPERAEELGHLARTLGFIDERALHFALDRARTVVGERFASLAPEAPPAPPRHQALLQLIENGAEQFDDSVEAPFDQPEIAEHLRALARRPDGLLGDNTRDRYPEIWNQVLEAIEQSPDPEQALRYLRGFFGRLYPPGPYVTLLAQDPRALQRLITVLGASAFVGDAIVASPDLVDLVLMGAEQVDQPARVIQAELTDLASSLPGNADEYERRSEFVGALRRGKQSVMIGVAVADLAGAMPTRRVTRILSDLADESLEQAVRFELGVPHEGLAVIALGKLGGRDIGYGSDLDVIFIFEPRAAPDHADPQEYFARRAQRIIRLITEPHAAGRAYELDTRLRPSGAQGLLVTSLRSFARYHSVPLAHDEPEDSAPAVLSSGAAWERQALVRARVCAGDRALGSRVIEVAQVAAYEHGPPPVEEIHHLRVRMERELGRESPPRRYDLKSGRGGLLDIEFATQWLQMCHGRNEQVRSTDTMTALEALHGCGYLERQDFVAFRDAHAFLRRLEMRSRVLHGLGATVISADHPGLPQLARRMGLRDRARSSAADILLTRYRQVTDSVRFAYCRVLGIDPDEAE